MSGAMLVGGGGIFLVVVLTSLLEGPPFWV